MSASATQGSHNKVSTLLQNSHTDTRQVYGHDTCQLSVCGSQPKLSTGGLFECTCPYWQPV